MFVLAVLFSVAGASVTVSVTVSVVLSGTVVCVTPCVEGAVLTSKYKNQMCMMLSWLETMLDNYNNLCK